MKYLLITLTCILLISCTKIINEVESFRKEAATIDTLINAHVNSAVTTDRPKLSIQLLSNLSGSSDNTADGVVKVYDDAWSVSIGNEDSQKIFGNPDEDMAINERDTLLMIEGKPLGTNDTTKLKIWDFTQQSYYLKITTSNFPADYSATIDDKYLSTATSLELNSTVYIPFDGLEDIPERFFINIKKQ